ncbi:tagaturonate reductase [Neolewinella agarilytica]|uniref:tagaturonate reductase n=1 Tax=Neolewinella agarilytica TaxID=478744 RepID=UPI0023560B7F|nr:tagaturonate reductase [Neolewinella agarilytica]
MEEGRISITILKELAINSTASSDLPLRVLQFGGGNFLRAFADWMIDVLNEKTEFQAGVVVVKPTERGDYDDLRASNGRFTVALDGVRRGELIQERREISCVQRIIQPYREREAFLATAELESMRFIISNTTEAGIRFSEEPMPEEGMPKEFPAKLTLWLYHRYRHFSGAPERGCIVLPMELSADNGTALNRAVEQYAAHWNLPPGFREWNATANHYCSTLVDRIVSGYPEDRAAKIFAEIGKEDPLLVAGEYYHSWVIAGPELVAEELPFGQTDLNVIFTQDLDAYREIKVRILNGAHTSIVPTGYLAGLETVGDVMNDAAMSDFLASVLNDEIIPSLDYPKEQLEAFAADVLDRFRNPFLHHKLLDISLNSTSKFRARLLPSLLSYQQKKGALPRGIVRAFAALMRFYRGDRDGSTIPLRDEADRIDFFREQWALYESDKQGLSDLVRQVLARVGWWGRDLNGVPGLGQALTIELKNYLN